MMSVLWCNVGFAEPKQSIQAAFVRGGDLWVKKDNKEQQVTQNQKVTEPKWSSDGKFIAYSLAFGEQQHEIWVYSLEMRKHNRVYPGGDNYQWSPYKNDLAFKIDGVLNTARVSRDKVDPFKNVTLGVGNYSWLPDGNGFLVSSPAQLRPSGWTNVELYMVPADAKWTPVIFTRFRWNHLAFSLSAQAYLNGQRIRNGSHSPRIQRHLCQLMAMHYACCLRMATSFNSWITCCITRSGLRGRLRKQDLLILLGKAE